MRLLLLFLLATVSSAQVPGRRITPAPSLPAVPREFRGVWAASVGNIDWPTQAGAPVARHQADLRALLDMAVRTRLNVVILQVRPGADALYASPHEPWSEYLTGRMGQAPSPRWDPLQFACDEAHIRGLELHAWINPFRARYNRTLSNPSSDHVVQRHPDWIVPYGNLMWMDPGIPEVREHVLKVVQDIVARYDVDGLHVDDYFYPYPLRGPGSAWLNFPDEASYSRYRSGGGRLEVSDWRRSNVDQFVESLYAGVHRVKPWVKVGISPFGIWRPGFPPGIRGLDQYQVLYSDARRWLNEGWCDYLAPQLYWTLDRPEQSFNGLLRWWEQENHRHRLMTPGLNSARIGEDRQVGDTLGQIAIARKIGAEGEIFWNATSLMRNYGGLANRLSGGLFAQTALVPPTPWLAAPLPGAPQMRSSSTGTNLVSLSWTLATNAPTRNLVLYQRVGRQWRSEILSPRVTQRIFDRRRGQKIPEEVRLIPISRIGAEGPAAVWMAK